MLSALVLVTTLAPPPEPNTTNYTLEATAAKAYGVSNYEIVKIEHPSGELEHEVTLLGSSNEEKGSVHIKETGGIQIVTVNEPNLAALTVTFDRAKEQMQLTMRGRTGTARPDRGGEVSTLG